MPPSSKPSVLNAPPFSEREEVKAVLAPASTGGAKFPLLNEGSAQAQSSPLEARSSMIFDRRSTNVTTRQPPQVSFEDGGPSKIFAQDIVAPKQFDFKNYFQKKQFKIQSAFAKPDSSAFIEMQTIYQTEEVQKMLSLSHELQQHA